jgi:uncharacterized protein (TIGR02145 family)
MKNKFQKSYLSLLILTTFLFCTCRENKTAPRGLITASVTEISCTTALSGGAVMNDGGASVISMGVCWDTSAYPTIDNNRTTESGGLGSFTSNITQLIPHTTYFVRSYATNNEGTSYGAAISFITLGEAPVAVTTEATAILFTSASLNGTVNANFLSTTVTFEYGTTTNYGNSIDASQSTLTGDSTTHVNINLTGLLPGTVYNFRIKTVNDLGTVYGDNYSFKTLIPIAYTSEATNITVTSATLNGLANPHGLNSSLVFMYGQDIPPYNEVVYNDSSAAIPSSTNADEETPIISTMAGLKPGTEYHYFLKMVNDLGTFKSSYRIFRTLTPTVTTTSATKISGSSATLKGIVNASNADLHLHFEYEKDVNSTGNKTISATPYNVSGNTDKEASAFITGLSAATKYSYRFVAVTSGGFVAGYYKSFTTKGLVFNTSLVYDTIWDIEDNPYLSIQIGTQTWMAENLKTTKYNDGTSITGFTTDMPSTTGAYRWYGNSGDYSADYGAMYNWSAVSSGKLCPVGWHVPDDDDWTQLVTYLGGETIAGGKLKETGTTHWNSPNSGADNSSGFSAVGAGNNQDMFGLTDPWGSQWNLKVLSYFWSDTDCDNDCARVFILHDNSAGTQLSGSYSKKYYCSVRCLKN